MLSVAPFKVRGRCPFVPVTGGGFGPAKLLASGHTAPLPVYKLAPGSYLSGIDEPGVLGRICPLPWDGILGGTAQVNHPWFNLFLCYLSTPSRYTRAPPMTPKATLPRWASELKVKGGRDGGWIITSASCGSCIYPLISDRLFFASTDANVNPCRSFLTAFRVECVLLQRRIKTTHLEIPIYSRGKSLNCHEGGKTAAELLIN